MKSFLARTGWLRLGAIAVAAVSLAGSTSTVAAANFNPPKHYYLALGDSIAFGVQLGRFFRELATGTYDPTTFNTGYVDDFAGKLRTIDPNIETVNLSCPGEDTASYLGLTPCLFRAVFPTLPLHTVYGGSQEAAALSFLRNHPGQVSPITIDIGLNDAQLPCVLPGFVVDVPCLHRTMPAAMQSVAQNLPKILAELHEASPSSEIILMTYYDPYFVQDPSTDALIASLDNEIIGIATVNDVRIADAFGPFNRTGDEGSTICALTLMCPNLDPHPTDAGYSVIAQQLWNASGFSRLGD
jgi:lysophospholipase L1-like esterase